MSSPGPAVQAPLHVRGPALLLLAGLGTAAPPVIATSAEDNAHALELAYTLDAWSLDGDGNRGTRYLTQVGLAAEFDLERLFDLPRTSARLHLIHNNGNSASELAGDAQGISNIETGGRALLPLEAWVEYRGDGDRWSLRAGLYDINSEFDALDGSALFLHSAHGIGTDIAQSGRNGPSIFPHTSPGLRLSFALTDQATLRTAVLDGVPNDPDRPDHSTLRIGGSDGAFGITELDLQRGQQRLLLGAWGYSRDQDDLAGDGATGTSAGAYLRGEALLSGDEARGLRGFFRVGGASARTNPFDRFYSVGLHWVGPFAGRQADEAGIAIAHAVAGRNQLDVLAQDGIAAARAETALELTYRFALTDRLALQPDLQYVFNPGLDRSRDDALAIGLRLVASLAH